MMAVDITGIANVVTWWGLVTSGVLLALSVLFACFESHLRKCLRTEASRRSKESLELVSNNLRGRDVGASVLKEARLTAGEVMEGWARAAAQPSIGSRFLIAAVTALGLAAGVSVTTTIFNPSRASGNGVTTTTTTTHPISSAPVSTTSR